MILLLNLFLSVILSGAKDPRMDEVTTAAKGHQQMPGALPFRLPLAEGGVVDLAFESMLLLFLSLF